MTATPSVPVIFGAATDPGRIRSHQEDSLVAAPPIFAVADGMGGHESGEFASGEMIDALLTLRDLEWVSEAALLAAFERAQEKVRAIASFTTRAAGTTVSGVALSRDEGQATWLAFNLGDSRTYRYARGELHQLTRDHSEVQELLDAGQLTADEARDYPRRNVLTRAVGIGRLTPPDLVREPIEPGDTILICSDGLTNELADERIAEVLADLSDPQQAADALLAEALGNGGRDNVSVVIVRAFGPTGPGVGAVDVVEGKTTAETTRPRDE